MSLRIEEGAKGDFWADRMPEGLSLMRPSDKLVLAAAVLSFLLCAAYVVYSGLETGSMYEAMPVMVLPFVVCGLIYCVRTDYRIILVMIVAVPVLWYLRIIPEALLIFATVVLIGTVGAVSVVEAVQRAMFYGVVRTIEYVNIKRKLGLKDRITAFVFSIPDDLDTRGITMNYGLVRTKLPWKEMLGSMSFGLMIGMFIWIYMSMNPATGSIGTGSSVPLFMLTLMLYIPVLVLPWAIFKSMNVRIDTNYRDFRIYDGIKATLQRMAVPVFAALLFVVLAINRSDFSSVMYFIFVSAAAIVVIVGLTSVLYYAAFESSIINDIVSKWKVFRPVPVFAGLDDDVKHGSPADDLPGTPIRDKEDFGDLNIPEVNAD